MRGRDIPVGLRKDEDVYTKALVHRGMRGSMELKVIGLIVLLSVAGFVFIQIRQGVTKEQTRLFRYKDDKGNTAYTDSLEKVPASQREAALKDKALPDITTADYDTYLEAVTEKKQEQKGFWDSLKGMVRSQPSGSEKLEVSSGTGAQKVVPERGNGKKPEKPLGPESLRGIGDVTKVINDSMVSASRELGGGD
jgi:hypothetical protein